MSSSSLVTKQELEPRYPDAGTGILSTEPFIYSAILYMLVALPVRKASAQVETIHGSYRT